MPAVRIKHAHCCCANCAGGISRLHTGVRPCAPVQLRRIGAVLHEQLDHLYMTIEAGVVQRCVALLILRTDILHRRATRGDTGMRHSSDAMQRDAGRQQLCKCNRGTERGAHRTSVDKRLADAQESIGAGHMQGYTRQKRVLEQQLPALRNPKAGLEAHEKG
jgi:hypothetical protein